MISKDYFNEKVKAFNSRDGGQDFYTRSKHLYNKGYRTEGLLLLLSTWNFAGFRYAIKQFSIDDFSKSIDALKKPLESIGDVNLGSIDLYKHREAIKKIYGDLSQIDGVKYTGASKIMHLMKPELFVMWDGFIRGAVAKRYYDDLELFKNKLIKFKKYSTKPDGYFDFLSDTQENFAHLNLKPHIFTKSIDEFNYVEISLPILKKKKQEKDLKKQQKK